MLGAKLRRSNVALALAWSLWAGCGDAQSAPLEVPALPANLAALERDVAQAIERAHEELLADPGDPPLWGRLGMVYHANHLRPAAEDLYTVATTLDPENARYWYRRALCLWELGRPDEAVVAVREAVRLAPRRLPPHWRLGTWLLDLGDLDGAFASFSAATVIQPGFPPAWTGLARIHLLRDESDEALEILERLSVEVPRDRHVADLRAAARRQAGFEAEGSARQGQSFEPLWIDPWEEEILRRRAESTLSRAIRSLEQGRPNRALPMLEAERELRPGDTTLLRNLAFAYRAVDRPDDALEVLLHCVELEPENTKFLLEAAELYEQIGPFERALELVERADVLSPNQRGIGQRRGRLLHVLGRHAEAIPELRKALEHHPDNQRYSYWLGTSLLAVSENRAAAEVLGGGLLVHPRNPEIGLALIEAHLRLAEFDAAELLLDQLDPRAAEDQATRRRLQKKLERLRARQAGGAL